MLSVLSSVSKPLRSVVAQPFVANLSASCRREVGGIRLSDRQVNRGEIKSNFVPFAPLKSNFVPFASLKSNIVPFAPLDKRWNTGGKPILSNLQ